MEALWFCSFMVDDIEGMPLFYFNYGCEKFLLSNEDITSSPIMQSYPQEANLMIG
jgi:hypothetical protein